MNYSHDIMEEIVPKPTTLSFDLVDQNDRFSKINGAPMPRDKGKHFIEKVPDSYSGFPAFRASVLKEIEKAVLENGTLDTIRFDGHGGHQGMTTASGYTLNVMISLGDIEGLQKKLGAKLANKIEFLGCHVFTNMNADKVEKLRNFSSRLDSEIIGTTSSAWHDHEPLISFKNGAVGQFTQGEWSLKRAAMDAWLKVEYPFLRGQNFSLNWLHCHQGKSQKEGEACQKDSEGFEWANQKFIDIVSVPGKYILGKIESKDRPR